MDQSYPVRVQLKTPAADYPVTVEEIKTNLGITVTDFDDLIGQLRKAATAVVELYLHRVLITTEFYAWYDFGNIRIPIWEGTVQASRSILSPRFLRLPRIPLQEVIEVNSYDDDSIATVFAAANYYVDSTDLNAEGRLVLRDASSWPSGMRNILSLAIEFAAGYGDTAADVPEGIRQGVLQLASYLFQNRGDCPDSVISIHASGAAALLSPYRIITI